MPRCTPCTAKRRAALLAAIAAGKRVELAAHDAGVSRRTAFNWRSADPALAAEWDEAYDSATDKLEDVLYKKALEGDLGSLVFALRSRMPAKYNPALIARLEMLALAKVKAAAENGLTIDGDTVSRAMIYPTEARIAMPRLLGNDEPTPETIIDTVNTDEVDDGDDDDDQEDAA